MQLWRVSILSESNIGAVAMNVIPFPKGASSKIDDQLMAVAKQLKTGSAVEAHILIVNCDGSISEVKIPARHIVSPVGRG